MSEITLGILGGGQLGSMLSTAAKKLNIKTPSLVNWFENVYGIQPSKGLKNILNNDIYNKIKINNAKVSRYLFEEIPYGLIPLIELGNFLDLKMSYMIKHITLNI